MRIPTSTVQLRCKAASLGLIALLACLPVVAQELLLKDQEIPQLAGSWRFNESLSDNTDSKVEAALRKAGERIQRRLFNRQQDRYRGGPADHELYDRISYDRELHINLEGEVYYFTYADQWQRPVYTDNRSRSVSLNALQSVEDFSLGHWENGKLLIESHPRDGGYTEEIYTLTANNTRLRVEFYIKPRTFREPIELTRVFDRQP